jgi:Na+/proline symporter
MITGALIVVISFAYVGLLFAIAYYGDKRADAGRSIIANPYIYTLSLAVYCTSWTFYGSVGRAATSGIGFLPIYLGPTLMAALWWYVLLKMIRISKAHRITSIADFIASRYGKSHVLGGLVTIIAVLGIVPYIALQLKAISASFSTILQYPENLVPVTSEALPFLQDNTFYVAMLLAAFTILFGTRNLDATERHEGLVAAIAFESVVKLVAFIAVGIFVTFGMFDGFDDLFSKAAAVPELNALLVQGGAAGNYTTWASLTVLSMLAVILLPRQFQVAVVENVNERHLNKAIWLFPLYLLAINIFVLPIALGGLMHFPAGTVDADTFVLTLPLSEQKTWLALLAFVGGLSGKNRPVKSFAGHTAQRHRPRAGAGLWLLLSCRRSLCAGFHRIDFVFCSGAVRTGHAGRTVLERRHPAGRIVRPQRRLPGLAVFPAAALLRKIRLAADYFSDGRHTRH